VKGDTDKGEMEVEGGRKKGKLRVDMKQSSNKTWGISLRENQVIVCRGEKKERSLMRGMLSGGKGVAEPVKRKKA